MFPKEKQFERLFRENYSRLYHYALDFTGDAETARDMVSELFSDLWKKFDQYKPESYQNYLFRAMRNRCINHARHLAVEHSSLHDYMAERMKFIDDDHELHDERISRMEKVIEDLPERTRYILEQCYYRGHKYKEVAELTGLSVPMVHKHISRALAMLRKKLNKND